MSEKPRGIRNNNPGNIKIAKYIRWKGKVPIYENTDGAFEQFVQMRWGLRAMVRLIRDTYMRKMGLHTIEQIIGRFAPSSENNTSAYAKWVAEKTGIGLEEVVSWEEWEKVLAIIRAMVQYENGVEHRFSMKALKRAWNDAIWYKERYQIEKLCLTDFDKEEYTS